ncbi:hypothetical protein [Leptolyngbya sp. PCC 6406]|uniref:hypothetical protein n=1 Tax=Leptolyngbya sp. PCC 6406 TaxID=1173264 RepID=UPI0002ABFEC8|nr:hypothetical protein [Leptolyngbya sp. PCC 6406]
MAVLQFPRTAWLASWLGSSVIAVSSLGLGMQSALAQNPAPEAEVTSPSQVRPANVGGRLNVATADRLVEEATQAIAAQDYPRAIEQLRTARELYNQLSGYHQELAAMFIGVDTRQTNSNRALALASAQKRDQTSYQLALVYRTQNRPQDAVPLLMEILRSQQPTRELGQRAYQQLYELGLVEAPFGPGSSPAEVSPANDGSFSVAAADRLAEEARQAISAQDYPLTIQRLQAAQTLYNQLSGYYQELAAMFIGVDASQTNSNRTLALAIAQKRDQTSYQLALVHRTQNRPEEAVALLMEILRSQQPTRELGQRAYQQLYELGLVEAPYAQGSDR